MVSFKYFWSLWSVSSKFWVSLGADHIVFHKNCDSMFYNCVSNGFYFALKSRSAGRNPSAVRVLFLKFPGKSKSGLHNKYMKWKKITHIVASAISSKIYEKWLLSDIAGRLDCFPQKFWAGKDVVYIRIAWHDKSAICSYVLSCFSFFSDRNGMKVWWNFWKLIFFKYFSLLQYVSLGF